MLRATPAGRSAVAPMSGGSEIPTTSRWRCCARGVSCLVPPLIGTRAHCGRLLGSVEGAIAQQAANGVAIDGWCGALNPIEWNETVVISRIRIGAMREQNLDGLHESSLGGVMQR